MEQAERIMDAARRLIGENGEAFTTHELAKEAGIALQTFYRYFPGKDQLLLAVLEKAISDSCDELERRSRRKHDPVDRLRFFIQQTILNLDDKENEAARRFMASEHYRLHQLFPDELAAARRPMRHLFATEIDAAAQQGLLRPRDADRDAWMVSELVRTTYFHYAFADREVHLKVVADDVWQFCYAALGGLTTQPANRTSGTRPSRTETQRRTH
jgi:AcrR family transcriptional regulator